MPHVFTVRELTQGIKEVLETEFPFVWVKGQVGNIACPSSGHVYFTLKDAEALLNVVWFKSQQNSPLSLGPETLKTGLQVICAGRINVYPPKGSFQLIAELIQGEGLGRLYLEFEALKRSLKDQGLFALEHKRPLPAIPRRIGVITAPTGAAIRDFLRISSERGLGSEIRIYPSLVQGEGAAENLALSIEQANLEGWAEVLVIIRGGGSLEDLWAFNREEVAQAIFSSQIPVITGIGHETDQTIADLTADQRAATPSHAAQLILPERGILSQRIDELENSLLKTWSNYLHHQEQRLSALSRALLWLSPQRQMERSCTRCSDLQERLRKAGNRFLQQKSSDWQTVSISLAKFFKKDFFANKDEQIVLHYQQLLHAMQTRLTSLTHKTRMLEHRLIDLDPGRPLKLGFSLVTVGKTGQPLIRADQVNAGDLVHIQTRHDRIKARIED